MTLLEKPALNSCCTVAAVLLTLALSAPGSIAQARDRQEIGPLPEKAPPSAALVEMGRRLFFDVRVSGDGAISCATCHDPGQGFTRQLDKERQPMALSDAYPGTRHFRNAPTLINVAHKADFSDAGWGWDGHMGANLNDVIRDQITETMMMNMDMRLMHERMKQDPVYVQMCQENFNGECSSGKGRKALDAFMQTLVSKDVPFDQGTLSGEAELGRILFEGKAGCIGCHSGPYFSDGEPHNTGVPENLDVFQDPLRHVTYRAVLTNHGVPKADIWRRDVGYFLVSKDYRDVGSFITPTLRETAHTAPYMHNGMFQTLEEVVAFYVAGGGHDDPLATELQPLDLDRSEQAQLVAFVRALSSPEAPTVEKVEIPLEYEPIDNWLEVRN
ncbi:MAG: photosynthetic protein synthase I [Acidiferrobacteraceae bacterium]|jgi:cytochrome c peroxidase|nr:photosynthetic protein synthase I [Acidiferrobacteraceae bacterium]MDP6397707.1 cytochrome c peroxidase [Arenicellales bacterium]MDP6551153.1 cytochrome c peroxidase [Arenicellales bacterium]MDP6918953.1 cytochrome c peroxidase [Arenicellales bacterium]|tara:strand:+ start:18831 stop:19988 length:1158 start_codon:yes stop_codon:yes gene_type:complete